MSAPQPSDSQPSGSEPSELNEPAAQGEAGTSSSAPSEGTASEGSSAGGQSASQPTPQEGAESCEQIMPQVLPGPCSSGYVKVEVSVGGELHEVCIPEQYAVKTESGSVEIKSTDGRVLVVVDKEGNVKAEDPLCGQAMADYIESVAQTAPKADQSKQTEGAGSAGPSSLFDKAANAIKALKEEAVSVSVAGKTYRVPKLYVGGAALFAAVILILVIIRRRR